MKSVKNNLYTKFGEKEVAYECTNDKCQWQGLDQEKKDKCQGLWTNKVCPKCENSEFYGLLKLRTKKLSQ